MVKDEECHDAREGKHEEEETIRGSDFHANWSLSKPCDACRISSALLYCRADSAYLCLSCDLKVHGANKLASRHERVLMCEVCEQAPAAVTCKADAAALCISCDADIHSANPLARRHERIPVPPFHECAAMLRAAARVNAPSVFGGGDDEELYGAEASTWLLANPKHASPDAKNAPLEETVNASAAFVDRAAGRNERGAALARMARNRSSSYKVDMQQHHPGVIDILPEVEPYLDVEYASECLETARASADSVVPVQNRRSVPESECLDADASCKGGFGYAGGATSLSHSVSSSSLEVGVVPDGTLNDISTPYRVPGAGFELPTPAAAHGGVHYTAMDREARVLRYKEKRKNRKFQKTIRYASRKAYAETRPRIKGRFAKRAEVDVEQMYAASLMPDSGYGVVPSF